MQSSPWTWVALQLQPQWDRLQQSEKHFYSITTRTFYIYKKPCNFNHKSVSTQSVFKEYQWKISQFEELPISCYTTVMYLYLRIMTLNELKEKKDMLNIRKWLDPCVFISNVSIFFPNIQFINFHLEDSTYALGGKSDCITFLQFI